MFLQRSARRVPSVRGHRWFRLVGAASILATAFFGPMTLRASAQAPAQSGWWTTSNQGSAKGLPTVPSNSGVPNGGLLAEGSLQSTTGASDKSPSAYAALDYQIPNGASVGALTLPVAPNSGTTPLVDLELCPLTSPTFTAAAGGPMSAAPTFNCTQNVTSKPSGNDTSYQFDVSSLIANGQLAVAVLPTTPGSRVVLSAPGESSLAVSGGSPTSAPGTSLSGPAGGGTGSSGYPGAGVPASGQAVGAPSPGGSSSGSLGGGAATMQPATPIASPSGAGPAASNPSMAVLPTKRPSAPTTVASAPSLTPGLASSSPGGSGANPVAVALLIAALAFLAVTWTMVGRAAGGDGQVATEPPVA